MRSEAVVAAGLIVCTVRLFGAGLAPWMGFVAKGRLPGTLSDIESGSITGHGDCLAEVVCEGDCSGSERLTLRNDIFIGHQEFLDPGDRTCFVYDGHLREGSPAVDATLPDVAPSDDITGRLRDAEPDIGAYEAWKTEVRICLPIVVKGVATAGS